MMRKKMKAVSTETDSVIRGMRQLRVSPLNATPQRNVRRNTTGGLEEQISELNKMVERIGKIDLGGTPRPTVEPTPSVSEESSIQIPIEADTSFDFGISVFSSMPMVPSLDADKIEITLYPTMSLIVNDGSLPVSVRAVLDSSSPYHLLTDRCRRKLKLPLIEAGPKVFVVKETKKEVLGKTVVNFSPYFNYRRVFKIEALVIKQVCSTSPAMRVDPFIRDQMGFFKLADPDFDIPASVDILIGKEMFPTLIKGGPSFPLTNTCSALQSYLGWVVAGRVPLAEFNPKKARMDTSENPSKASRGMEYYFCNVIPPEYRPKELP